MKSANFDGRAGGKQKFATSARDPVEASHIRKPTRPLGIHGGEGGPRIPSIHPRARPKAVLGFRMDLQQPGRRNSTAQEVPIDARGSQPGIPIARTLGSRFPCGKMIVIILRRGNCIPPVIQASHYIFCRRPSTPESPYRLGIMGSVAAGPNGSRSNPHRPTFAIFPICGKVYNVIPLSKFSRAASS